MDNLTNISNYGTKLHLYNLVAIGMMKKILNLCITIFGLAATLNIQSSYANCYGSPMLQIGWYAATQGKSQHVNIEGLIGDHFSVSKSTDQNLLVGIGYLFEGFSCDEITFLYGINAFYLAPTKVKGKVTQEDLFTNLSYHYSRTNYPIYFTAKTLIQWNECSDFTMDVGIGPNITSTGKFKEKSLDGNITIPDRHLFSGKTIVEFTATAGLGWRINNLFKKLSLEIDYRFFYLGKGRFKRNNSQLKNTLHTGNSYGNALFFSFSI